MKKLLLLLPALLLLSCETEEVLPIIQGCDCERVVSRYGVLGMNGVTPVWGYEYQYTEDAPDLTCEDESEFTNDFVHLEDNLYYTVKCD